MITTPTDPHEYFYDKYEEPRHHLTALLGASVFTLDIPTRPLYQLEEAGVRTVADLIRLHRSGLRAVKGIGRTSAEEIERILTQAGLTDIEM